MIGPGDAVPCYGRGNFHRVFVGQENGATLRRYHVEDHAEQLPLKRFVIADGTDGRADLQQRTERAVQTGGLRQRGQGVRVQIDELVVAELLFLPACGRRIVQLHWANGGGRAFRLKKEKRAADADLVARREEALLYRDAVDESAGGGVQIGEQQVFVLTSDLAVHARDCRVFDTNRV